MSDLISRQALCEYALNQKDKSVTLNDIMRFPSAQPEKRTEERTNERTETHGVCLDTISRQAAIDVLDKNHILGRGDLNEVLDHIVDRLENLPSAQPEIVRCKDCKYWNDEFAKDKSTCWLPCMSMTTHREWHCGSAERRTDEDD